MDESARIRPIVDTTWQTLLRSTRHSLISSVLLRRGENHMEAKRRTKAERIVFSDPEWEKAKSARRNIGHDEAVQESFKLQKQFRSMWSDRMAESPVELNEILRTLTQKRIPFVLTGAQAIGGWTGRPRATYDVDILVKGGRNHARAVNAIKALYPNLEVKDFAGVTAFFIPGEKESVIDVTYPHRPDIGETLDSRVWVENKSQGLRYRIPSLEAALANKYGAMLTPGRDSRKRRQDVLDFEWMVVHSMEHDRQPIDLAKLELLGEKVWPGGGGKEILRLVDEVKTGHAINLDSMGKFIKSKDR
jgi:Nucleotidyl transferase AbiEii toxin, Type IV TA system